MISVEVVQRHIVNLQLMHMAREKNSLLESLKGTHEECRALLCSDILPKSLYTQNVQVQADHRPRLCTQTTSGHISASLAESARGGGRVHVPGWSMC